MKSIVASLLFLLYVKGTIYMKCVYILVYNNAEVISVMLYSEAYFELNCLQSVVHNR